VFAQVFDLSDGQLVAELQAADDTVNGVSFSPCLPLLATASGHRRYPLLHDDDGGGADADASLRVSSCQPGGGSNGLRLWRLQAQWQQFAAAGGGGDAAEEGGV
jgi:hypothetical protein